MIRYVWKIYIDAVMAYSYVSLIWEFDSLYFQVGMCVHVKSLTIPTA